jgi:hypothetical protein
VQILFSFSSTDLYLQGGKKTNRHSMLGREANKDPAAFASISGRLNSIANLKHKAKALNDEQRVKTKMVSDPTNMRIQILTGGDERRHRTQCGVAGLALRDCMLHGRKPSSKRTAPDSDSSDAETGTSDKENRSKSGTTASKSFNSGTGMRSTSASKGKRRRASTLRCSKANTRFDTLMDYMQGQAEKRERFEQAILEEQHAGRVLQECAVWLPIALTCRICHSTQYRDTCRTPLYQYLLAITPLFLDALHRSHQYHALSMPMDSLPHTCTITAVWLPIVISIMPYQCRRTPYRIHVPLLLYGCP